MFQDGVSYIQTFHINRPVFSQRKCFCKGSCKLFKTDKEQFLSLLTPELIHASKAMGVLFLEPMPK